MGKIRKIGVFLFNFVFLGLAGCGYEDAKKISSADVLISIGDQPFKELNFGESAKLCLEENDFISILSSESNIKATFQTISGQIIEKLINGPTIFTPGAYRRITYTEQIPNNSKSLELSLNSKKLNIDFNPEQCPIYERWLAIDWAVAQKIQPYHVRYHDYSNTLYIQKTSQTEFVYSIERAVTDQVNNEAKIVFAWNLLKGWGLPLTLQFALWVNLDTGELSRPMDDPSSNDTATDFLKNLGFERNPLDSNSIDLKF